MAEEMRDWRELCAAIVKEKDRVKLLELMEKLLAVLDERRNFISGTHAKSPSAN
jgi:hypothetical protein